MDFNKEGILYSAITELLKDSDKQSYALVIDSAYFLISGKLVYVKKTHKPENGILFYQEKSKGGVVLDLKYVLGEIKNRLLCTELYEVCTDASADLNSCTFRLDTTMRLIILESHLYSTVRKVVESNTNYNFFFGGQELSSKVSRDLINAFKENSLKVYQDLIFSKISNRFVQRLYKVRRFFAIQHGFIPVFINYEYIYNPIEATDSIIKNLSIYKNARKETRKVSVEGILSCYMMTHLELCKAFNMRHFIRFTPRLCYRVLIGLIYQDNQDFPNITTMVMLKQSNGVIKDHLKSIYSVKEYLHEVEKAKSKLDLAKKTKSKDIGDCLDRINILEGYQQVTSLYAECFINYSKLVNFGAIYSDPKIQVNDLYSFLREARLGR